MRGTREPPTRALLQGSLGLLRKLHPGQSLAVRAPQLLLPCPAPPALCRFCHPVPGRAWC